MSNIFKYNNIYIFIITILTFLQLVVFKNEYSFAIYGISLFILIMIYSRKTFNTKRKLYIFLYSILYILSSIAPLCISNSNTILILLNGFFWIILLFKVMFETNVNDSENIDKKYPIIRIIYLYFYPIIILINTIRYPIMYIKYKNKFKKKNKKKKIKISTIIQTIIGLLLGFILLFVIVGILILSDADFYNAIESVFQLIDFSQFKFIIISFVWAYVLHSNLFAYKFKDKKYPNILVEDAKNKVDVSRFSLAPNIVLVTIFIAYLVFITFEIIKLLVNLDQMYGQMASNMYYYLIITTCINIVLIVLFYWFYSNKSKISKTIRTFILLSNITLLTLATVDILVYINNISSITYKRYYGLIVILFLFLFTIMFIVKTINKRLPVNKGLLIISLIMYIAIFIVDVDSIIYNYNVNHIDNNFDEKFIKELDPVWFENEYK